MSLCGASCCSGPCACVCGVCLSAVGVWVGLVKGPARGSSEPGGQVARTACWRAARPGAATARRAVSVRRLLFVPHSMSGWLHLRDVWCHTAATQGLCVCLAQRGVVGWAAERTLLCCCLCPEQNKEERHTFRVEWWHAEVCRRLCPCRCVVCCRCCLPTRRVNCNVGGKWFSSGCEEGLVCSSSETPGTVLASQLCGTHHVRPCGSLLRVLVATAYVQCHATQCPVSVQCCLGLLYGPVCHEVGQDPFLGATGPVAWP